MNIKPRHLVAFVTLPLWLAISTTAFAQAARIAVLGDPSLSDLVDVTTARLSALPDVTVLERSDLDKLGQEKALQAVVGSNDFSTVNFLPADGLVILRAVKKDGKVGVFARLVAVQPGIVLREVALSDGDDASAHADDIVTAFAAIGPKLTAIQKGHVTALSLLGLRFELDSPQARELERSINVLLASRLSAEPDTVVLERWRLNDAVFEKSLGSQTTAPFWTGSSLIDGSMTLVNKVVTVNLRVRPPTGPEISISDQDAADNLPTLVRRLADKIQAHPMAQGSWKPFAEADHFAGLGKWCVDNGLYEEGAEAIESALALGDVSDATHRQQIRAYSMLTFPEELPDRFQYEAPTAEVVTPESLAARVKWGTLAANLTTAHLAANSTFSGQPGAADDPVGLSVPVLNNCLRLLRYDYQKGVFKNHDDETTALRHAVQNLISQMEPLVAKSSPDLQERFLTYQVRYAPFWHETPGATIDYYRELLNRQTDGAAIRAELFTTWYLHMHPPCLLPEAELPDQPEAVTNTSGDWYVASPRILDWNDPPVDQLMPVWENFLKESRASSDPVQQADALKFDFSFAYDPQNTYEWVQASTNGARLIAFLDQNQDSLSGPRGNDFLSGFDLTVGDIVQRKNKDDLNQIRALGEALLKKQKALPVEWFKLMSRIYYALPADGAVPLLASLDAYRQWYLTQTPQDAAVVQAIDEARKPLAVYAAAAAPVASAAVASPAVAGAVISKQDSLTVNQHWPVQMSEPGGMDFLRSLPVGTSLVAEENKVWFVMFGSIHILCVDPSNLQTLATYAIPDQMKHNFVNTAESACVGVTPHDVVAAVGGRVMLCSREDNTWRQLDLPPSNYKPWWVDQQLYLTYDTEAEFKDNRHADLAASTAISGLFRVTSSDGAVENLVSTRRIPPQNPLDGKPFGFPTALWSSSRGLRLSADSDSPHFQVYGATAGKNDWASLITNSTWCDVKVDDGKVLVGRDFDDHGFAQIALMNDAPGEILLSNPTRAAADSNPTVRWDIPDDIRLAPKEMLWHASPVMRGDDLCLFRSTLTATHDGVDATLYYFTKGKKTGLEIPLKFQGTGKNSKFLWPMLHGFQSLLATDYGLIAVQEMGGFWVVPWKDIDAYRARVASENSTHASVMANVSSTP